MAMVESPDFCTEYRIAYEWVNQHVTSGDYTDSLEDAKSMLEDASKTFNKALTGAWVESRQVTSWQKA